ncbi:MAG: hypothetical protein M1812_001782 [Candelaria pacifica]|nr:MAG: hypothetical protein M1812_001782 [Candelaria pacifica]
MSTDTIKLYTASLLSFAIISLGTRAILSPIPASKVYGVPATNTITSAYVPVMGARNVAIGLAASMFILRGDIKGAGTVFSTALLVGAVDSWVCYKHWGRANRDVWGHLVGDGIFGGVGLWLME